MGQKWILLFYFFFHFLKCQTIFTDDVKRTVVKYPLKGYCTVFFSLFPEIFLINRSI